MLTLKLMFFFHYPSHESFSACVIDEDPESKEIPKEPRRIVEWLRAPALQLCKHMVIVQSPGVPHVSSAILASLMFEPGSLEVCDERKKVRKK